ncbi:MAG: hypothetical protein GXX96_15005 [Planctomycetaceae bacterium]|jgi:outer membrane lipoprotein-sorting protein|nr:hypothetical protein [Planctomycetaceae bacterium]
MCEQDHLDSSLADLGATLRRQPSLRDRIITRIAEAEVLSRTTLRPWYRSRVVKVITGLAACLALLSVWRFAGQETAGRVFAAAIESVRQARTFSCRRIEEDTVKNRIREELIMFREPGLQRREDIRTELPHFKKEISIRDYGSRKELRLFPSEKTAYLEDKSSAYEIDENTGRLKLRELDTSIRDQLIQWSQEEDVEDLGRAELDGRTVRLLKSRWGKWDVKVWVNPRTRMPVQVVLSGYGRYVDTYTSIEIDGRMDDGLFSLVPPEDYQLREIKTGWSDGQEKVSAKMAFLAPACYWFADKHNGRFPVQIGDLAEIGIKKEVLKVVLAAPDQPDGPAVIRYRRPAEKAEGQTTILMHEAFETWPERGLVVCFLDGHREIIRDQKRFEEMLK